ncbi:DUF1853 family protein [Hanstruepera flava]|uniref:DUF1853 family protein n=1 Tax=Hanstruepera flava TaxID=2930218 RepID=UPI00202902FA|nr:DUF1853 family protein [Hanstruepera flava]
MVNKISNTQIIKQQYYGYCKTPNLWFADTVLGLNQFKEENVSNPLYIDAQNLPKRLGKRVEHFVFHNLKQNPNVTLLAENLQIQHNNQTIGELDALIVNKHKTIHLEIIYKFYLYDPHIGSTELDHWIGPNQKDSLVYKLDKLTNKQLPLLHAPETQPYLERHGLDSASIDQQVLFLAQLFVPKSLQVAPTFKQLNAHAVMGTFLRPSDLDAYTDCHFYIPQKLDWLIMAHHTVSWLPYALFQLELQNLLDAQRSPLIWIRHPDGELERLFVVWW